MTQPAFAAAPGQFLKRHLPLVLALLCGACVEKVSSEAQPKLWARACALSTDGDPTLRGEEFDVERANVQASCEADFNSYPRTVANRSATCFVELQPKHGLNVPQEIWRPCIGDDAQAYFDKRATSFELVSEVYQALTGGPSEDGPTGQPSPRALAEALHGRVGAWGEPPALLDNGKDSWHLCDPGPDRKLNTRDDLCSAAPFIYFQF